MIIKPFINRSEDDVDIHNIGMYGKTFRRYQEHHAQLDLYLLRLYYTAMTTTEQLIVKTYHEQRNDLEILDFLRIGGMKK